MDKGTLVAIRTLSYKYWAFIFFKLLLCTVSCGIHAKQEAAYPSECSASSGYLSKLQHFFSNNKTTQDYSCLTNFLTISKNINTYQLIDTRSLETPAKNAWNISVDELKLKTFLGKRPLLLLSEGFSRVEQATACATLKKSGFSSIKILVGGYPHWENIANKEQAPVTQWVSSNELIYEYFNGRVVMVAATKTISTQLKEIGFSDHHVLPENTFANLGNIVISSSGGGYDPVVYIGTPADINQLVFNQHFSNLYFLQGGFDSLVAQLKRDQLIEYSRAIPQDVPFCAKK